MRSWGVLAAVPLLGLAAACAAVEQPVGRVGEPGERPPSSGRTSLSEVKVTAYGVGQLHLPGPVAYAETPPMGGPHAAVPLVCGSYPEPVPAEHAVHALEHGVVWLTFDPAVVDDTAVRALERGLPTKSIISPHAGLPSPVVVTVWDRQLALTGHRDRGLADFLAEYGDGHTAPEPNVPCNYGVTPEEARSGTSV